MHTTRASTATTIDGRLGELLDRQDITTLVSRLGACLDEGRFEQLRTILTPDSTARTPGGLAEGIDAVVAQASRNHDPGEHIQHLISDVLVDLDGDGATVRANLHVTFARGSERATPYFTLGEVYAFRARRTPEGWRLTHVGTEPVWSTGSR